jgi:hypothetical protein
MPAAIEAIAPAGQALLHRVFADAQRICHGAHGLSLAIKKNERHAVGLGQFRERVAHHRGFLFAGGGFVRRRRLIE